MAHEVERKWAIDLSHINTTYLDLYADKKMNLEQGYIPSSLVEIKDAVYINNEKATVDFMTLKQLKEFDLATSEVRFRIKDDFDACVTFKSAGDLIREEVEFPISFQLANKLKELQVPTTAKTRYIVDEIEIDVYHPRHGLSFATAEVEFKDKQSALPYKLNEIEVTNDQRFKNKNLARASNQAQMAFEHLKSKNKTILAPSHLFYRVQEKIRAKYNLIAEIAKLANIKYQAKDIEAKYTLLAKNENVLLIALCGESAAGKTTFLNALKNTVADVTVVNADNYFCDISKKMKEAGSFEKLVESGYDTESASNFQMDMLYHDLKQLKHGQPIDTPLYEMKDGTSLKRAVHVVPTKVVVVESICTFFEKVRGLFDLKLYLSVDKKLQRQRFYDRAKSRGQNPETMDKMIDIVTQAAEKHIIPNKQYADMVFEAKIMDNVKDTNQVKKREVSHYDWVRKNKPFSPRIKE